MTISNPNAPYGSPGIRPEGHSDNGHAGPGFGHRVDSMNEGAHMFFEQARGVVNDVTQKLDLGGRIERNPYGTLLLAAGVGYILGGGLFTPLTGNLVKLGLRLAALPLVKDELLGMAQGIGQATQGYSGPGSSNPSV